MHFLILLGLFLCERLVLPFFHELHGSQTPNQYGSSKNRAGVISSNLDDEEAPAQSIEEVILNSIEHPYPLQGMVYDKNFSINYNKANHLGQSPAGDLAHAWHKNRLSNLREKNQIIEEKKGRGEIPNLMFSSVDIIIQSVQTNDIMILSYDLQTDGTNLLCSKGNRALSEEVSNLIRKKVTWYRRPNKQYPQKDLIDFNKRAGTKDGACCYAGTENTLLSRLLDNNFELEKQSYDEGNLPQSFWIIGIVLNLASYFDVCHDCYKRFLYLIYIPDCYRYREIIKRNILHKSGITDIMNLERVNFSICMSAASSYYNSRGLDPQLQKKNVYLFFTKQN